MRGNQRKSGDPVADLRDYLAARRTRIDAALQAFLPIPPACPAVLSEAMRYSVFAGGKRFRPILTLAAAEAVAELEHTAPAAAELAIPAACAIELVHTYSLIHDDLPAMDDDTLRRGRPTAHVMYGEGIAILAGDALLTEAFAIMAREPVMETRPDEKELNRRKLRAVATVAEAAGYAGMAGGQAIDLASARPHAKPSASGEANRRSPTDQPLDADGLRGMHERKTGALIRAAAVAGAIMAGAPEPLIQAVERYGAELGLAFQIVDDILDVEGAASELGKTVGKDAASGKPTYPAAYGIEESRRLAAECVARAQASLDSAGIGGQLSALADWVIARTS